MLKVWWWPLNKGSGNAGDEITPALLTHFDIPWERVDITETELVGAGSTMRYLPPGYKGIILGTGVMDPNIQMRDDLQDARILAVRGPLTASYIDVMNVMYADTGLLAPLLIKEPLVEPTHPVGWLPHWEDDRKGPAKALTIDITRPPAHVITEIAKCEKLVTSSLHGIIFADALGIQSKWMPKHYPLDAPKFNDYAMSMNQTIQPKTWREAPAALVAEKQAYLEEAFRSL